MTMHSDHYDGSLVGGLAEHLMLLAVVIIAVTVPVLLFFVW